MNVSKGSAWNSKLLDRFRGTPAGGPRPPPCPYRSVAQMARSREHAGRPSISSSAPACDKAVCDLGRICHGQRGEQAVIDRRLDAFVAWPRLAVREAATPTRS